MGWYGQQLWIPERLWKKHNGCLGLAQQTRRMDAKPMVERLEKIDRQKFLVRREVGHERIVRWPRQDVRPSQQVRNQLLW